MDQLGARSLFTGMSQPGATPVDDGKMLDIIHDRGGFEDRQVDESELELYTEQPSTYTHQPDSYTKQTGFDPND